MLFGLQSAKLEIIQRYIHSWSEERQFSTSHVYSLSSWIWIIRHTMHARMTSVMWLGINLGAQQRWMKTDTTSRRIRMEQKTGECVWTKIPPALAALSLPEVSANQSTFHQGPFKNCPICVFSNLFLVSTNRVWKSHQYKTDICGWWNW